MALNLCRICSNAIVSASVNPISSARAHLAESSLELSPINSPSICLTLFQSIEWCFDQIGFIFRLGFISEQIWQHRTSSPPSSTTGFDQIYPCNKRERFFSAIRWLNSIDPNLEKEISAGSKWLRGRSFSSSKRITAMHSIGRRRAPPPPSTKRLEHLSTNVISCVWWINLC